MKRFLALLILAASPALAERSLYWDAVAVKARLDDRGKMHVSESQSYVFDGDWNGGERSFRIEPGQTFEFEGISRVDRKTGEMVPLTDGSLSSVDEYSFTDPKTLRWRSRLPEDPPFSDEHITYVLTYTLGNILIKRGDQYLLDHDFAFPKRSGEIRTFTLELDLDPAWTSSDLPRRLTDGPLPPGRSVIVRGTLDYHGAGGPDARADTLPVRLGTGAAVVLIPVLLWWTFMRREERLGRFLPLSSVDPAWVEEHLMSIPAEVVGAAWDEAIGQPEVSALLARWAAEKKITATPVGDELSMRLRVPRDSFQGAERELIDKLFISGEETSTSAIRAHYKSTGFSPGSIITKELQAKVDTLIPKGDEASRTRWIPTLLLFISVIALVCTDITGGNEPRIGVFAILAGFLVLWGMAAGAGISWRAHVDRGPSELSGIIVMLVTVVGTTLIVLIGNLFTPLVQFAFAAATIMIAHSAFNSARSRRGRPAMALRKQLTSVRQYFIDQLQKANPALDDRWFPYIVAFELNTQASTWMRSFGAESGHTSSFNRTSSSSGSSSSSDSSPRWTGGGGTFGGAGATATWGAAAGSIAAGVAAPSSSSSGGGGGGGGSSSGGGGGGGW